MLSLYSSEHDKADWETDETFCETVRHKPLFNNGKMLLDIIDAHTFDFLTGTETHHFYSGKCILRKKKDI